MTATTVPHASPHADALHTHHDRRWWTLAVLSLSLVIIGLDNTVLNVALPTLQREFSATSTQLQWMVDAYVVVFAGMLLTLGALGDRFGRARALQAGLVLFASASLAAAYAPSAEALIVERAIMGIGGALIMPSTLSILIDVFPRQERPRAIAIWSGVAGIGVGLGPLIAGLLLKWFWWGSVFMINVPIAAIALIAGIWLVPDSRDPEHARLDLPGAALSMASVSLLVYAIIEAPVHGWTAARTVTAFAAALALLTAFAWWEVHTTHPMLDFDIFRNRRFSIGAAAIGFTFFALFGTIFAFTQYLQFVRGFSALEAGTRLLPLAFGLAIGARSSERIAARVGTTPVVALGMVLVSGILGSFAFLGTGTPDWVLAALVFMLALGMGNVMAPATTSVMGAIPEAKAGVGSAMNDVVRQVAGAFGIAIIGSIINTVYRDRMQDPTASLPGPTAHAARDSVGAALAIARQLPAPASSSLAEAARHSFLDAMGAASVLGMTTLLLGAAIVRLWLPTREDPEAPGSR